MTVSDHNPPQLDSRDWGAVSSESWYSFVRYGRYSTSAQAEYAASALNEAADWLIRRAEIGVGDTVLDIGTGEGLVGMKALDQVGESGHVVFSDISPQLVRFTETRFGDDPRTSFEVADFNDLASIPTQSIDLVVGRSVLLFADSLSGVFAAVKRVLKDGGRAVFHEWLNSQLPQSEHQLYGFEIPDEQTHALVDRLRNHMRDVSSDRSGVVHRLTTNDIVADGLEAGFDRVEIDSCVRAIKGKAAVADLDGFINLQPNPFLPTMNEMVEAIMSEEERSFFYDWIDNAMAAGDSTYLRAPSVIVMG